ncbi:hypothetical protein GCM10008910_45510 [Faecalicatena orotica]|uniref:Uncharacterized protein n=1 Tax=Faecalicatena orotica TaxID=1544 RepID=A0A2Y9C5A8_9FIRM|nr:hypothetical protein [Faecalicatena orotica]PWJ29505.1 hypothetical protein A8806_106244 [Faecalicatena orotica]SSA55960.1 hypothetical protein SAMN05216536_106244 [Faecalicatena orotica]
MGIINVKFNEHELNTLASKLQQMNSIRFDGVVKKNITEIFNRSKDNNPATGGTPVSTEATRPGAPHGELRLSAGLSGDEMGYLKDYAPHVEYGHRTKNGGYVPGQHFLQNNVNIQGEIYRKDLLDAIKRG